MNARIPLHPDEVKSIAGRLLNSAKDGKTQEEIAEYFVKLLDTTYSFPAITRSDHQIWYRARICDGPEGWGNVREMLYPPSGSPSYGRASLPGDKVLYAGWNPRVALDEIHAKKGQFVQIITLRVRAPFEFPCAVVGEHQSIFNSGSSIYNSEKLVKEFEERFGLLGENTEPQVFVDSVIADIFRTQIDNPAHHVTSATISAQVFKKEWGLMYSSVRTTHAVNLAVRANEFDTKFEVLNSDILRISDYHGYGLFSFETIRETAEIKLNGDFDWSSTRTMPASVGERRAMIVPSEFVGWRVK